VWHSKQHAAAGAKGGWKHAAILWLALSLPQVRRGSRHLAVLAPARLAMPGPRCAPLPPQERTKPKRRVGKKVVACAEDSTCSLV